MDWDAPQTRCLVALNELAALDFAIRERLPKSTREHTADFDRLMPVLGAMGADFSDPSVHLDAKIGYLRRAEAEEKRVLRHSRRNIFAIGFSTFERCLELNFPEVKRKPNSFFFNLGQQLKAFGGVARYFSAPSFNDAWDRANCYRVARNKITHQAGYFSNDLGDDDKTAIELLKVKHQWGVFFEPVEDVANEQEIIVSEVHLSEILEFFQKFAMEIEDAARGMRNASI